MLNNKMSTYKSTNGITTILMRISVTVEISFAKSIADEMEHIRVVVFVFSPVQQIEVIM